MSERRLAAILSLDVVGYSRMMQTTSGSLLRTLNILYRDLVTPVVKAHKGRVVKLLGDGALVEFPSAARALEAAIAVQRALREPDNPYQEPQRIMLRAGLHVGDVVADGDDIFGDGVNIAARLQSAAEPGGVLVSRMVSDLVGAEFSNQLRGEGVHTFKGITQPIEVLSVEFLDEAEAKARKDFEATQKIQYCRTDDGVNLAWSAVGGGSSVVKAPNWIGHLELDWSNPGFAPICTSIAKSHRLVRFDARLNGLSDWEAKTCTFERSVDDLEAIFDAASVERAPILAMSQGCAVAAAFAVRRPERVSAIAMLGGFPVGRAKRKSEKDLERARALRQMMTAGWDDDYPSLRDLMAQTIVPRASEEVRRQYANDMREMISAENMGRIRDVIDNIDIRHLLPSVEVPCLLCHAKGDRMQPVEQSRIFAKSLPNSRLITYESNNHLMTENDPEWPRLERDVVSFFAAHG